MPKDTQLGSKKKPTQRPPSNLLVSSTQGATDPAVKHEQENHHAGGVKLFETGSIIPESGVWQVTHSAHRLPHDVMLLSGDAFPRCAKCADAVSFELIQAAPAGFRRPEQVHLYELPVIEDEDTSVATTA
jgi:hypothetical protein